MKILIFVILMDILIFGISSIFVEDKPSDSYKKEYFMDRYGYQWKVDE